jgi:3-hydroxybutyrate dehydrogenase
LVTGASRGIGAAIAAGLTRAGFRVALTARNRTRLTETCHLLEPGDTMSVAADLADPDAPSRILAAVEAQFGTPKVIVNNAGTAPSDRFEKTSDATLDQALDLHVRAPFRLLRAALPKMRAIEGSCVVQMASTAGLIGFPFTAAYTAAKHGMIGLTRALSAELGENAPRVYAVCPGFVDTDITRQAAADIASRGKQTADEALTALGGMNEIGRMHTVDEVARAVLHLVATQPEGCVYNLDRDPPGFV